MGKAGVFNPRGGFDFEDMDTSLKEAFNINVAWLATLHKLMVVFLDAKFTSDFEAMFESIDSLAMCLYPKMGPDNREKVGGWVDWLEENKDKWCVKDSNGNIRRIHPENRRIIRRTFMLVFKELISYMENVGLLTKDKKDPTMSLGNITG